MVGQRAARTSMHAAQALCIPEWEGRGSIVTFLGHFCPTIPTLRRADFPSLPHVQKQVRSRTIYGGFKQAKKATNTCKKRQNCLLEQSSVRKITVLPKRENIKKLELPAVIGDGSV